MGAHRPRGGPPARGQGLTLTTGTAGPFLLEHDDEGSGPAVVLLHAGVADRRMWAPVAESLASDHRVIAPDLRGFGATPLPGGSYADADDVVHLLDALDIERAAVVGASFGGRVALELATRHPDRVASLVLLCAAHRGLEVTDPVLLAFGEREDALLEAGDVEAATALNVETWAGPDMTAEARDGLAQMQRRAFEVQLAADAVEPTPQPERVDLDLADVAAPTLVVSGAHDVQHFRDLAVLLSREIPGAELVELDWAGHLPALERPDDTVALLRTRLGR